MKYARWLFLVFLVVPLRVDAQDYPDPSNFDPPLAAFTGRWVDSSSTRDYQTAPRTYRAKKVTVDEARNRVYMIVGEKLVAWDIATFYSKIGGGPTSQTNRQLGVSERYLKWDYQEDPDSEWETTTRDHQQHLFGFDVDDRGYVYMASTVYGWGTVLDTGSSFSLQHQVTSSASQISPSIIEWFKNGGTYYLIVSNQAGTKTDIWNVTTPSSPTLVRTISAGTWSASKTSSGGVVAVVDGSSLKIYTASALASGGAPTTTISPQSGSLFWGVSSDGKNFFAVEAPSRMNTPRIVVAKPVSSGSASYTSQKITPPFRLRITSVPGIRYADGYLALWGQTDAAGGSRDTAWVYRVEPDLSLELLPMRRTGCSGTDDKCNFFLSYYNDFTYGGGKDMTLHERGGKTYLFKANFGLGDVYELESPDQVSVSHDAGAGYGTPNPNSPSAGSGPYPGDLLTFKSTFSGAGSITVNWDFGNPESLDNTTTSSGTATKTHRFRGANPTGSKTVTVTEAGNSSNTDSVTVSVLVPTARVGVDGTDIEFPGSTPGTAEIVFGDDFVDKSDGAVESHYNVWTISSVDSKGTPLESRDVGLCGVRSLGFVAHYISYTGTGEAITPTSGLGDYLKSLSVTNYEVKPFRAAMSQTSDSTQLTFRNETRVNPTSGAFASGASTPWSVQWIVVPPAGDPNDPNNVKETDSSTVGTEDTFVLAKPIATGTRVIMRVTMTSGNIAAASCQASQYLKSSAEVTLNPPDPQIAKSGCTTAGGPCTFTASSISGANRSDWSYQWKRNDSNAGSNSQTYSPSLQTGSHSVYVAVTNSIGTVDSNTITVNVQPPACATGLNSENSFSFSASCQTNCGVGSPIEFTVSDFFADYSFGDCDEFDWTFGDGDSETLNGSSGKSTSHSYGANGTYNVRVTIRNENSESKSLGPISVSVGTGGEPPPPPCPSKAPVSGQIFPGYTCSGGTCESGKTVSFKAEGFPYQIQSCDTFQWSFGDGGTSTSKNPSHVYAAAGTYNVSLKVLNSKGSATGTVSVVVEEGVVTNPDCLAPSASKLFIEKSCETCAVSASITFSLMDPPFGYTVQECDTFLWEFGDGATSTNESPAHIYSAGGTYTVKVTVTNTAGAASSSISLAVQGEPIPPPTGVKFAVNTTTVIAGITEVTFTGSQTGGDPATKWVWDFDDGTVINGPNRVVTHTFNSPGSYTVTATASNPGGSDTFSLNISVAEESLFVFMLPAVIHADGAFDSKWRTDVHMYIPGVNSSNPMTLEVEFKGIKKFLVVDSSTFIYEDFLQFITSAQEQGPVLLRGNSPNIPQMWTRTYNVASTGVGTFGQLIPAVLLTGQQDASFDTPLLNIGGLQQSTRFRTNVGFANPNGIPISLTATVYEQKFGLPIGSFDVALGAYASDQRGLPQWFPGLPADIGALSLRISNPSGLQVIGYASITDNTSNDPVYVSAVPDGQIEGEANVMQVVPGVGHVGAWRSDISVFNPDSSAVAVDIIYYDTSGAETAKVQNLTLPSKGTIIIDDVLRSGVITPVINEDSLGTLEVITKINKDLYPVVFARTYNDQLADGTYGQGIPAFASSRANVVAGRPAFVPGVRSDSSYYTNLGLNSLATTGNTEVRISLLDPMGGQVKSLRTVILGPKEAVIISRVIQNYLYALDDRGTIKVEVVEGGPIWAYASIVDQTTFDPEYVPASPANN